MSRRLAAALAVLLLLCLPTLFPAVGLPAGLGTTLLLAAFFAAVGWAARRIFFPRRPPAGQPGGQEDDPPWMVDGVDTRARTDFFFGRGAQQREEWAARDQAYAERVERGAP